VTKLPSCSLSQTMLDNTKWDPSLTTLQSQGKSITQLFATLRLHPSPIELNKTSTTQVESHLMKRVTQEMTLKTWPNFLKSTLILKCWCLTKTQTTWCQKYLLTQNLNPNSTKISQMINTLGSSIKIDLPFKYSNSSL
jgi:hypothetical protein